MELTLHAGPARMRRGTQGHVAEPRVAHMRHNWRRHLAGGYPDGSTWTPVRGATWQVGWHMEGPQVGWHMPGYEIGAVTQMRYRALVFKLNVSYVFLRLGLCPTRFLPVAGVGFGQR